MTTGPPVPPASYWPDGGSTRPATSKPPGWAVGIMSAAAVVALIGGTVLATRDAGSGTPVAQPPPEVELPVSPPSEGPSARPSLEPSSSAPEETSEETPEASPSATATSTFAPVADVPEVCDLLPESLTSRLAPKSSSAPGVAKDGYGAKRKDCRWDQKGYHMAGGYNLSRSINVKVNAFQDHDNALEDADFMWDSMRDFSGQTREDPYNTKYGEIKELSGLGDSAYMIYSEHTVRHTSTAWIYVVRGNVTLDIRFIGADNKGREILSDENSRPVPEAEMLKGVEEIAKEVVKGLSG
ncbi:hypothetical protein AB0M50_14530 [Nonomuraea fuscirosea]|jgi:hypothetical protein|uniref:hypothetical protein n=1 Tax=Nonomuraea fuscirosea TaxID=1291556 RepID=UPI0034292F86